MNELWPLLLQGTWITIQVTVLAAAALHAHRAAAGADQRDTARHQPADRAAEAHLTGVVDHAGRPQLPRQPTGAGDLSQWRDLHADAAPVLRTGSGYQLRHAPSG